MKIKFTKKQKSWCAAVLITAILIMIAYCVMFRTAGIASGLKRITTSMAAITYGVIIALIMTPMLNMMEKKWLKPYFHKKEGTAQSVVLSSKSRKNMRRISVFLTELILILIIVVLMLIIVPQTIKSIQEIASNIVVYLNNANNAINDLLSKSSTEHTLSEETRTMIENTINGITNWLKNFLNNDLLPNTSNIIKKVSDSLVGLVKNIFNFIIGIIVSVYLLYSKEKLAGSFKKLAYAFFNEHPANVIIGECRYINRTFVGFISGKILDSIIIGIICLIGTRIIGTPYSNLVSVMVGVTNIIPFFGPYIGAIFGLIIIVLINPLQALYFLIFVLALQQFDGNILGPKILGDSTGISSFWVIFSIMFFGGIWGVAGWIVGVPIFAIFYHWVGRYASKRLRGKQMPDNSKNYIDTDYVENGELHSMYDDTNNKSRSTNINNHLKKIFRRNSKDEDTNIDIDTNNTADNTDTGNDPDQHND
mgnify:FL=1